MPGISSSIIAKVHSRFTAETLRVVVFVFALIVSLSLIALEPIISSAAGGCAVPTFRPAPVYGVGLEPRHITNGDLNGDGKPDIVTANNADDTVSILMNDGTGVFTGPKNFPTNRGPQTVAIGDFNADGKPDLAVATVNVLSISLLTGDGTGNFGPPTHFNAGGQPFHIVAADFNGDGRLDVATSFAGSPQIAVLLGDGAGGFGAPKFTATGNFSREIAAADFNQDGKADLAAATNNGVYIMNGNGAGGFSLSCSAANPANWVSVGDLNADGKPDLVSAWSSSDQFWVHFNNGSACLTTVTMTTPQFSQRPNAPALIADFNEDGKADFIIGNSLYESNGAGNFAWSRSTGVGAQYLTRGDFNSDGHMDLAGLTYFSVSVFFGLGDGKFANVAGSTFAMASADLNGDGQSDLVTGTIDPSSGLLVFLSDGSGVFKSPKHVALSRFPSQVAIGDFNNDQKPDLLTNSADTLWFLAGDGAGNFGPPSSTSIDSDLTSITPVDLNNDGNLDVVATYQQSYKILIRLGDGHGAFGPQTTFSIPLPVNTMILGVGDFNKDGKIDLAVPNYEGVQILSGNGLGGLALTTTVAPGVASGAVAIDDFNRDGVLDIASVDLNNARFVIALGQGAGSFGPPAFHPVKGKPQFIRTADVNLDGFSDVVVAEWSPAANGQGLNYATALLGDGMGGMHSAADYPIHFAYGLVVADFTRDGRSDIVTSGNNGVLSVLINTCSALLPSQVQLSASTFSVSEAIGSAQITITRTDTSGAANVDYATSDQASLIECSVVNGIGSSRCDYATSTGTVRFAAGEASKTIFIPIVDDGYAEGAETFTITLSNPIGTNLGSHVTATITIQDNESANTANPIDGADFFIRQQYIDFLGREPDAAGLAGWRNVLNNCGTTVTPPCDRIEVSAGFFRSEEFQSRGYFIYRFYSVVGRIPLYHEFMPDFAKVSGFQTAQQLEANKVAFINEFMARAEFHNRYQSTYNSTTEFVEALLATVGLPNHPSKAGWIAAMTNGTLTRAQMVRQLVESSEVSAKYNNEAFVIMQYFGYLRRTADASYLNWIQTMNQSNGDYRTMINGFMNSSEYRRRFGP